MTLLLAALVLGAQLLSAASARSDHLADLQRKTAAYQDLRQNTEQQLSNVAAALAGPDPASLASAVRQLSLAGYTAERLSFVAPDEAELVDELRVLHGQFVVAMTQTLDLASAAQITRAREVYATQARPLADRLERRTDQLVHKAQAEALDSIEESHAAYQRSLLAIMGFGVGAVALAILLGVALSLSIVRPIRAIEARFAGISQGEFSRHVAVTNRDELGTLASDLNRMSDELARLYDEVRSANRHKSEFLANMSHELRTPLNAVIGFSDVLEQRMFGELNARQAEYVRDIAGSGRHLLDLVNEILDLSKVEAGRMELEPVEFALGDAIRAALLFVRERAAVHGIELAADLPEDLGTVTADERKMRQVLLNLLSNAVKFTPNGGLIAVSARRSDGEIQVSVRDSGIGIAPEDQPKVFEEFQQVGKPSDRSREGTGLGLTLAKRFIELHGGRIWLESELGRGTTFTFALPIGRTAAAPA